MHASAERDSAIAEDFSQRFEFVIADTEALRREVYRVRCQVFCDELGYAMDQAQGCESDNYDGGSLQILLRHRASGAPLGCFRFVLPYQNGGVWLPFEHYGMPHIDKRLFDWGSVNRLRCVEVSRLALCHAARHPERGNRGASSPYLATAMFYAVSALIEKHRVEHAFMVIEPALARLTSRFGFKLDQISPPFEYYGQRATFVTTCNRIEREAQCLKTPWRRFFEVIQGQLFRADINQEVA